MPPHTPLLEARMDVPEPPLLYHAEKERRSGLERVLFLTGLGMFTPIVWTSGLLKPPPTMPLSAVALTPPPFTTARAFGEESAMPDPPWITVMYFVHTSLAVTAGRVVASSTP